MKGDSMTTKNHTTKQPGKNMTWADYIPHWVWLCISLAVALGLWTLLSVLPSTSRAFPNAIKVFGSIKTMIDRGKLFGDIASSLRSVTVGYILGFVTAVPVAFLMSKWEPVTLFHIGLSIPCSTIVQIIICSVYLIYMKRKWSTEQLS